jgi:hypothetical protein
MSVSPIVVEKILKNYREKPKHHFVVGCEQLLERGFSVENVNFVRERKGLSFAMPHVFVEFRKNSTPAERNYAWHPEIESWLISHHGKAINDENEIERMGYYLRFLFEDVPCQFGEGFINSILAERLGEYCKGSEIVAEKLSRVTKNLPFKNSVHYKIATEFLDDCLVKVIEALAKLDYSKPDVTNILEGAIAYFLDERFSITNRKNLGFD